MVQNARFGFTYYRSIHFHQVIERPTANTQLFEQFVSFYIFESLAVVFFRLRHNFWCFWFLVFRCIINCRAKVSPVRPLTLRVVCSNRPCISIAIFSWTLHIPTTNRQGNSTWSKFKDTTSLIRTSINTTQFHLPRLDALPNITEGQKFQVQVTATDHNGILQEQALHTFDVNSPPKLVNNNQATGCQVRPTEGFAIITDFTISCLGWYDNDIPLRYAFKYIFSFSTIIIQDGNVGDVTSKLPLGDPDDHYKLNLTLQIIDAYGEVSAVELQPKVRRPITWTSKIWQYH